MNDVMSSFELHSDEVIEVALWISFDIKKDGCAFNPQLRTADNVYFLFTDRERFQRMMIFLGSLRHVV